MKLIKSKLSPKVSAGSMADIAFLLLIFFLVATNLVQDKDLTTLLPPDTPPTDVKIKERNLFKVQINSKNQYLIEDEIRKDLKGVTQEIKDFVLNPNKRMDLSENPEKAIISIKSNRGTKYASFIEALDMVKETYYQTYGSRAGLTSQEFRQLDRDDPIQNEVYLSAREGLPMNISMAEQDKIN